MRAFEQSSIRFGPSKKKNFSEEQDQNLFCMKLVEELSGNTIKGSMLASSSEAELGFISGLVYTSDHGHCLLIISHRLRNEWWFHFVLNLVT